MTRLNDTCVILLALAVIGLLQVVQPPNASAQSHSDQQFDWLRAIVDSTMKAENIPALSIGVVMDGELVYTEGFGFKSRDSKDRVDEKTLYQIGSDSKKLTGIIAKSLALDGHLELDTPIVRYLEGVLTDEAREKLKRITLRHLLEHRSGVPYRAPTTHRVDGEPMLIPYSEEDLIHDLNNMELTAEPGGDSGYSNFGYAVAGYVCERASGESYETLLDKYVTITYNMRYSSGHPSSNQRGMIAVPYRKDDRMVKSQPWNMGKMTPAGGVYSNIVDSAKLMIAQLAAYREHEEVSGEGHPLIITDHNDEVGRYYGFGLGKTVSEHGTRYGHGGDLDGYASAYLFSPERNGGLLFLTTSGGRWVGRLESQLRSRLFEAN